VASGLDGTGNKINIEAHKQIRFQLLTYRMEFLIFTTF